MVDTGVVQPALVPLKPVLFAVKLRAVPIFIHVYWEGKVLNYIYPTSLYKEKKGNFFRAVPSISKVDNGVISQTERFGGWICDSPRKKQRGQRLANF
jgi:hypothetical protein